MILFVKAEALLLCPRSAITIDVRRTHQILRLTESPYS